MLQHWMTWITTVQSSDEDVVRRGRMNITIILAVLVFSLPLGLITLMYNGDLATAGLVNIALICGIGILCLYLARRGAVSASSLLLLGSSTALLCSAMITTQEVSVNPIFFILQVVAAGLLLRPWQIWIVVALCLTGLFGVLPFLPTTETTTTVVQALVASTAVLIVNVGLLEFLGARAIMHALTQAREGRSAAEVSAALLAETNATLEQRVGDRTAELQFALDQLERRSAAQARLLAENAEQRDVIREMSVPVLPISATTLVMPLVGALDTQRLQDVQEQALAAIERSHARRLLLDVTGVPVVDSQVAQGLLYVVQAARLLGAAVLLIGVRPEVAQALVSLGADLPGLQTCSDLQTALLRERAVA